MIDQDELRSISETKHSQACTHAVAFCWYVDAKSIWNRVRSPQCYERMSDHMTGLGDVQYGRGMSIEAPFSGDDHSLAELLVRLATTTC
jgi:hypothetical protein